LSICWAVLAQCSLTCSALVALVCSDSLVFFSTDPAPAEIYTLSLHDALPICCDFAGRAAFPGRATRAFDCQGLVLAGQPHSGDRSEEHTSELQSRSDLVCRLLLEKKKPKLLLGQGHGDIPPHTRLLAAADDYQ